MPPRARRCSTPPMARSASASRRSACAKAGGRRDGLSFVAVEDGRIVGTVRLWDVAAGADRPALLLGPLAVDPAFRRRGIGAALMRHALHGGRPARPRRRAAGRRRVVLRPLRLLGRAHRQAVAAWARSPRTGCSAASSRPVRSNGAARRRSARSERPARTRPGRSRPRFRGRSPRRRHNASPQISWTPRVYPCGVLFRSSAFRSICTTYPGVATNDRLARSRPHRWPDRDDRLRFDRQRHAAADRAAISSSTSPGSWSSTRGQGPRAARRARHPLHPARR